MRSLSILRMGDKTAIREYVLIIASSGRMLAQAAQQANFLSLVVDLYADQDTEVLAQQVCLVPDLSLETIRSMTESLALRYAIKWVVYGSGLEYYPETLFWLADNFQLIGNKGGIFKLFADKKSYFKRLGNLQICYPEVCFVAPKKQANWLIKPVNSLGGIGVSRCQREAEATEYYQKFCNGQVGSVLFCANDGQFKLIGFQRQWSVSQDDFTFAGMMRETILPATEQQRVLCWLRKLVGYYQLQGLGSLDFIWDGKTCYYLEINPRPPASMLLYPELDLFSAHIGTQSKDTSGSGIIESLPLTTEKSIRALQIIFAIQTCKIKQIEWPKWSFDRPKINTDIVKGEPICSIVAQGMTIQQVENSLLEKQQFIENNIY